MTLGRCWGRVVRTALSCMVLFSAVVLSARADAQPLEVGGDQSSVDVLRTTIRSAAGELLSRSNGERVHIEWSGAPSLRESLVHEVEAAITAAGAQPADEAQSSRTLRFDVGVDTRHLDVTMALEGEPVAWWRRLLRIGGSTAWQARMSLDPELRRHAAPLLPWSSARVVAQPRALPSQGYLAARVVDLDRDGDVELLLLHEQGVDLMRVTGRQTQRIASASLPALGRTAQRARRSFGTLALAENGFLARLRSHAAPFAVQWRDGELHTSEVQDPCDGGAHPLDDACALPVEGRDYYASELVSRVGYPAPETAPTSFYARVVATTRSAQGNGEFDVELVVTPRGRLVAKTAGREVGIAGYGAALSAADTDGDGAVELLSSSDAPTGSGDFLRVLRVREDGTLLRVWESERLEGSITVAGSGDLDGDGLDELIAIEERANRAVLWVVDAATSPAGSP